MAQAIHGSDRSAPITTLPGSRKALALCSTGLIGLFAIGAMAVPARAQTTYVVPDGGNFSGASPLLPGSPADGTIISLGSTATGDVAIVLPTGSTGLAIHGASGGSTVSINSAGFGGGSFLVNTTSNPLTLDLGAGQGAVTFTGANGGTASNFGHSGSVIYSVGSVVIDGALNANGNATADGGGGAIFVSTGGDYSSSLIAAGDVSLLNNHARVGGAIYAGGVELGNAGAVLNIQNNSADSAGGGISGGTVTLTGRITLSGNQTAGSGGGIEAYYGATINGDLVANGNTARTGGAIYADTNGVVINGSLTADHNVATASGGVIAIGTSYAAGSWVPGNVTVTGGVSLTNNRSGLMSAGGAMYVPMGDVALATGGGDVTLRGNVSAVYGGALYVWPSNTGTTGGHVVIGNGSGTIAVENNFSGYTLIDPSLPASPGNVMANSDHFAGGAIEAWDSVTLRGTSITLDGNYNLGHGGAISSNTIVRITGDVEMNDNLASHSGGGIYAFNSNSTSIPGGADAVAIGIDGRLTAHGNTAVTDGTDGSSGIGGGVLYASRGDIVQQGGDVSMSDNQVEHNGNGGAIVAAYGNVTLAAISGNATLTGNRAGGPDASAYRDSSGGAIYAHGDVLIGNPSGTLTLSGNGAMRHGGGIYATGDVTLYGTDISGNSAGLDGGAIWAGGNFSLTSTTADTITNNSVGGLGGAIWAGGDVSLTSTGGAITFSGNTQGVEANALYMDNTAGGATLTLRPDGNPIVFQDPIQNNAVNGLIGVIATGPGMVIFDGADTSAPTPAPDGSTTTRWSRVYGDTTVQAGAFVVRNNAVYGALAADVGVADGGSFTVDDGAILAGGLLGEVRANRFTLNGILDVAGAAAPGNAGGGFSIFRVTSTDARFGAGGVVLFNTWLNDASTQRSDVLELALGGTSTNGTAGVLVNHVGGAGAVTIGNGIELVRMVGAGSSANAFALAGRVIEGPYEYLLFHGSVDASAPENWYLRSTIDCTLAPNSAPCLTPTPPEEIKPEPPTPPIVTPPESIRPDYRAETSLYTAMPAMQLLQGRILLDTLHERVGDEAGGVARDGGRRGPSQLWGRLLILGGSQGDLDQGIYGGGPYFKYSMVAVQMGLDLYRDTRNHVGVYGAWGRMNGDVWHWDASIAGQNTLKSWTVGGYWTHFGDSGWYTDLVAQYSWDRIRARTIGLGTAAGALQPISPANIRTLGASAALFPNFAAYSGGVSATATMDASGTVRARGHEITLSLEAGKPFALGHRTVIEPQGQIVWQTGALTGFSDPGADVHFDGIGTLEGRLGARLARNWSLTPGHPDRLTTLWIRPSLRYVFKGAPEALFSSDNGYIPFRSDFKGASLDLTAGVDGQITEGLTAYASGIYLWHLEGLGNSYGAKAGLRLAW